MTARRAFCCDFVSGPSAIFFGHAYPSVVREQANAYELLFSFSSSEEKDQFLELVRSNLDRGNDYIENDLLSPTTEEIRDARPLAMVLPQDVLNHAALIATTLCRGYTR
jgi:hypothetical protein